MKSWGSNMPDGFNQPQDDSVRDLPSSMADRLIVALDVKTVEEATSIVNELEGVVSFFKVGYWLYNKKGYEELISLTTTSPRKLFLDAKIYDVPETVREAVSTAVVRGASFVTVHGDEAIMRAAVEAASGSALKVFAVTVLTNLDTPALEKMGYCLNARDLVMLKARAAVEANCHGIIASADDNPDRIRELSETARLLIATPGIRLEDGDRHDQKRVATPREAIFNGADYLVVGRPIVKHPNHKDVRSAALEIISEMQSGWDDRQRLKTT
jgi:orotidine-5'-phosphate decarboxylase